MTLLTAVNRAQRRLSLAVTATIIADGQEAQNLLYELANIEAEEVLERAEYDFPALKRTQSFTASLASLQASGKPSNFRRAMPDTFWNATQDKRIAGPLTDIEWATLNGQPVVTVNTNYAMFRYDGLHLYPAPTVADTITYEYLINTPVLNFDGVTYQSTFANDSDTYLLGDRLLVLGLVWRYKADKGRDYAEDLKSYEMALAAACVAARGSRAVSVAAPDYDPILGPVNVPETGFGA